MKPIMIQTLPQQKEDKMVFPGEYQTQMGREMPLELQQTMNVDVQSVLWCSAKKNQYLVSAMSSGQPMYVWIHGNSMIQESVYVTLLLKVMAFLPEKARVRLQKRMGMTQHDLLFLLCPGVDILVLEYYDLDAFWHFFDKEHAY
jgi:hypothetical protein